MLRVTAIGKNFIPHLLFFICIAKRSFIHVQCGDCGRYHGAGMHIAPQMRTWRRSSAHAEQPVTDLFPAR
jgi:hypothetical protein